MPPRVGSNGKTKHTGSSHLMLPDAGLSAKMLSAPAGVAPIVQPVVECASAAAEAAVAGVLFFMAVSFAAEY